MEYGFELNEFDPFFNFRATEYLVENGYFEYLEWHDELSWYPNGRNISKTSQAFLHTFTAATYGIFGGNVSLYDYVIVLPVILGSLTSVVIFFFVRTISGTTAGLLSSLLFSISIPILVRGSIGWFKSEPLGLFLSLIFLTLLSKGIISHKKKNSIFLMALSGLFLTFSLSSWGGNQLLIGIISLFILSIPFFTKNKNIFYSVPIFTITTITSSMFFERLSFNFIYGFSGLILILTTILFVSMMFLKQKKFSNKLILLFLFSSILVLFSISVFLSSDLSIDFGSFRYQNAINPFLTTQDVVVASISEHSTTTIHTSFLLHSVFMIFASIGIWLILTKNNSLKIFKEHVVLVILLGFFGVYIASSFSRLEVFASISVIVFASIGISILFKNIFTQKFQKNISLKLVFLSGLFLLLISPLFLPVNGNIFDWADVPQTILNGGSSYKVSSSDWIQTLDWIKKNTPPDSIIVSWWDYGYWIETLAERTTLIDNATVSSDKIKNIAKILFQEPSEAKLSLEKLNADYIVIFVAAEKIPFVGPNNEELFTLNGGGDEAKKFWILEISGLEKSQFLHSDGIAGTSKFWNDSLIGNLIPYSLLVYVNPDNPTFQSDTYVEGYVPVYTKDIKLQNKSNSNFNLVYSSSSFNQPINETFVHGVFVYEIIKDETE